MVNVYIVMNHEDDGGVFEAAYDNLASAAECASHCKGRIIETVLQGHHKTYKIYSLFLNMGTGDVEVRFPDEYSHPVREYPELPIPGTMLKDKWERAELKLPANRSIDAAIEANKWWEANIKDRYTHQWLQTQRLYSIELSKTEKSGASMSDETK